MRYRAGFATVVVLGMGTTGFAVPTEGEIRGRVRYPACFPPSDLAVCAEAVGSGRRVCTTTLRPTEEGLEYAVSVPAGRWVVYAVSPTDLPGMRGYYSRAVLCGLTTECHDHTPIVVDVSAGGVVEGINPEDWVGGRPIEAPPRPTSSRAPA